MQSPGVPFTWLTLPLLVQASPDGSWCYDSQNPQCGPSHWKDVAHTCGGTAQSPIDIDWHHVKLDPDLGPFVFEGYDSAPPGPWQLLNDGHTVLLSLGGAWDQEQGRVCIWGGGLPHIYCALQLHFHWGSPTGNGSEHTLNGQRQPMEMHMVHMNTLYQSLEEARGHPGGLAVLAFLFKVQNEDNANYNTIVSGLKNISHQGESVELASTFRLDKLLPDLALLSRYYRYPGSLTTPACDEVVLWTIFEEPVPIGRAQLAQFVSTLQASPPGAQAISMINNFRPAQPIGSRRVLASPDATVSGGPPFPLPMEIWALLCLLLSMGCGSGPGGAL